MSDKTLTRKYELRAHIFDAVVIGCRYPQGGYGDKLDKIADKIDTLISNAVTEARVKELELAMRDHAKYHGNTNCPDTYSGFTYLHDRIATLTKGEKT